MLHKQFSIIEIYQVKININATNIKHNEPWLNDKSFNHINNIVIGALVMFTKQCYHTKKSGKWCNCDYHSYHFLPSKQCYS
jgi:hypothetical protein